MAALKHSRQRDSIKEFLMTRKDHPTADIVYHELRKIYPRISLGTVYRNLSLLSDMGEILKLTVGDGVDHFDACTRPHYHVVCTSCHRVDDLPMDFSDGLDQNASRLYDGEIQGHTTTFYGVCSQCLQVPESSH